MLPISYVSTLVIFVFIAVSFTFGAVEYLRKRDSQRAIKRLTDASSNRSEVEQPGFRIPQGRVTGVHYKFGTWPSCSGLCSELDCIFPRCDVEGLVVHGIESDMERDLRG